MECVSIPGFGVHDPKRVWAAAQSSNSHAPSGLKQDGAAIQSSKGLMRPWLYSAHGEQDGVTDERREEIGAFVCVAPAASGGFCGEEEPIEERSVFGEGGTCDTKSRGRGAQAQKYGSGIDVTVLGEAVTPFAKATPETHLAKEVTLELGKVPQRTGLIGVGKVKDIPRATATTAVLADGAFGCDRKDIELCVGVAVLPVHASEPTRRKVSRLGWKHAVMLCDGGDDYGMIRYVVFPWIRFGKPERFGLELACESVAYLLNLPMDKSRGF